MIYNKADIPADLQQFFVRAEIGLEETPEQFIAKLVEVFREVRRVLRDDGTCWVNMGDSYAGSWGAQSRGGPPSDKSTLKGNGHIGGGPKVNALSAVQVAAAPKRTNTGAIRTDGVKPKDLYGIPWMLAFALRADGWYLRQDIIWSKPNPMPESVTDRCTKSHEYIFLLSKSPRYYCDMEAIKEESTGQIAGNVQPAKGAREYLAGEAEEHRTKVGLHAYAARQRSKRDSFNRDDSKRAEVIPGQSVGTHRSDREESEWDTSMRNRRSVWTVSTKPYSGAHFATFPEDLIEPCILAGAPAGGVVLDPFMGSGTTGEVAQNLGRQWIGCELNPAYEPLQRERLRQPGLIFEEA